MDILLDLRNKSGRPVHLDELRRLTELALLQAHSMNDKDETAYRKVTAVIVTLSDIFKKITNSVKSCADVWDIYSYFLFSLGKEKDYFDCLLKQVGCFKL